mgnify:CR=1 FL=1
MKKAFGELANPPVKKYLNFVNIRMTPFFIGPGTPRKCLDYFMPSNKECALLFREHFGGRQSAISADFAKFLAEKSNQKL